MNPINGRSKVTANLQEGVTDACVNHSRPSIVGCLGHDQDNSSLLCSGCIQHLFGPVGLLMNTTCQKKNDHNKCTKPQGKLSSPWCDP